MVRGGSALREPGLVRGLDTWRHSLVRDWFMIRTGLRSGTIPQLWSLAEIRSSTSAARVLSGAPCLLSGSLLLRDSSHAVIAPRIA